ncbi:putative bifunctional diguanylate cyclase/phosphodiesterase [Paenibacillus sp. GCM10023248]|uniref:putative bifunctional diguanylate cyclase/phosphodiesterase n=1 Tax=Bacillales TaxID=1385 RepID=UPI002379A7C5|nr:MULTISPECIES: GGDEF domain-containing phosphodiesterase [Bacillales]MDD9267393.1 EAL domain-containing protein [Paenibacillus sp. MAHUQ-63]MDR6882608.1 diguanylate cyclase (GGDEF)-like protein/PAS domain S-box-containing protein [Bacillus sp. 3255]
MKKTLDIELLLHMLDDIEDSIYVMSVDGSDLRYFYVNRAASRFSGVTMEEAGRTFFEANTSQMANYLYKKYKRAVDERRRIRYEDGVVLPNGLLSGESILTPIFGEDGQVRFIFSVTRDITERKKHENLLYEYAYHDELSKLVNRRYLMEHVSGASALYLLDLDYFKNINDMFGHDVGDTVLIQVADRLTEQFGEPYTLVRLGGDEFIVVEQRNSGTVEDTAERIIRLFHEPFSVNDRSLKLSASIGVSRRTENETLQTLLKQADIALYKAKSAGRRRFHIYEAAYKYDHVENFIHELALSQAIEKEELHLQYQLICHPGRREVIGAEALLRWNCGKQGFIQPNRFIPVAEDTGLIVEIGYWVIRQACKDWHRLMKAYGPAFKVSVNISRVQLNEPDFGSRVMRITAEEGVTPQSVELEITESATVHSMQDVKMTLRELRAHGFTIALDDFGTGYSSLSMLTLLPIDKLKIDRSFIADGNVPLITAILAMAQALNLLVIAEGIETEEQCAMLQELNCWGLQGYYFNKPVDWGDLPAPGDLFGKVQVGN